MTDNQGRQRVLDPSAPARPSRALHPRVDTLENRRLLATYVVNSLADILSPPTGIVTLRDAIQMANSSATSNATNVIDLSVAGNYQITTVGGTSATNAGGELAIYGPLISSSRSYNLSIVNTSGGRVVVDGGGLNRVFDINPGGTNISNPIGVTFQDLTIADGVASGHGGGIQSVAASVTLDDVVLENNDAYDDGGAVYVGGIGGYSGNLTIDDCTITDNSAATGGGVYAGSASIEGSVFQGNVASVEGGALSFQGASSLASVSGSRFTQNLAPRGGAIEDEAATLTLQYCTLDQNHAYGTVSGSLGGGLYIPSSVPSSLVATVSNCLFLENSASDAGGGGGGAISEQSGSLDVINSQLSGNIGASVGGAVAFAGKTLNITGTTIDHSRTNGTGGAVYFNGVGSSTLVDDTLAFNVSGQGGGIYDDNATVSLSLISDTINGNSSLTGGGGVYMNFAATLEIEDTILAQNDAGSGYGPDVDTPAYHIIDDGGNLVGDASGSVGFMTSTLVGTASNPLNPGLGPLMDHGSLAPYTPHSVSNGPSGFYGAGAPATLRVIPTEALATTSPAFAAGVGVPGLFTDERGFARPTNANPSIGAYQPQYAATATPAQVYVEGLYEVLLGRTADPGGVAYWSPQVSLTASNAGLVRQFVASAEYRDDQIDLFYVAYLGRPADGGGVSYWLTFLDNGGSLAQVQSMFLGGTEYFNDHGGNDVTVVESIYENLLDRVPTTTEVDFWVRQIQANNPTNAVALDFILSPEAMTDLILADYSAILGRGAATSEVNFWLGMLAGSMDPETFLIGDILGSSEAFSLRTTGLA